MAIRPPPGFQIPEGLIGRFAIVKLRTNLKTAEDEVIERVKRTSKALGIECLVVDFKGRLIADRNRYLTNHDVDFVIHLHFETPKCYDIFSFAALWNPLQFFYDWGYRQFSQNLSTHDDYLSCSSAWADDHIRRLLAADPTRVAPELHMYHSLSEPIIAPKADGEKRLFYTGMNWEKLVGRKSRHEELLSLLDAVGLVRIYGPRTVNGVEVWGEFRGYVGPVPFDGVSMVHEIANCGVSLVLSSDAHKESGLMSNRLFESLAAGAIAICDEHPFGPKFFGDTLLYIDTTLPAQDVFDAVVRHLDWIETHPEQAIEKARQAQRIFLEKFSLDHSLREIYTSFPARKQQIESIGSPAAAKERIAAYFLMPECSDEVLERHCQSIRSQTHPNIVFVILVDTDALASARPRIERALGPLAAKVIVFGEPLFERNSRGELLRRRIGDIIGSILNRYTTASLFCLVAPHERLFSDHLQRLAAALDRNRDAPAAYSDMLLCNNTKAQESVDVWDRLQYMPFQSERPFGFGRFLFRRSSIPAWADSTIPYLHGLAIPALVYGRELERSRRSTLAAEIQNEWWLAFSNERVEKELEVVKDIFEDFDSTAYPEKIAPKELSLAQMQGDKLAALADQLYSASFPSRLEPKELSFRRLTRQNRYDLALALYAAVSPDELEPRRLALDRLEHEDLMRIARELRQAAPLDDLTPARFSLTNLSRKNLRDLAVMLFRSLPPLEFSKNKRGLKGALKPTDRRVR